MDVMVWSVVGVWEWWVSRSGLTAFGARRARSDRIAAIKPERSEGFVSKQVDGRGGVVVWWWGSGAAERKNARGEWRLSGDRSGPESPDSPKSVSVSDEAT